MTSLAGFARSSKPEFRERSNSEARWLSGLVVIVPVGTAMRWSRVLSVPRSLRSNRHRRPAPSLMFIFGRHNSVPGRDGDLRAAGWRWWSSCVQRRREAGSSVGIEVPESGRLGDISYDVQRTGGSPRRPVWSEFPGVGTLQRLHKWCMWRPTENGVYACLRECLVGTGLWPAGPAGMGAMFQCLLRQSRRHSTTA